jgi:hypothetical protein
MADRVRESFPVLTVGDFRRWTADERDECPIRVIVYTADGLPIDGIAAYASGNETSVGAVNIILDKNR